MIIYQIFKESKGGNHYVSYNFKTKLQGALEETGTCGIPFAADNHFDVSKCHQMPGVMEGRSLLCAPWLAPLLPLIAEAVSPNSDFKAQTPKFGPSTSQHRTPQPSTGRGARAQQPCLPALHCQVDGPGYQQKGATCVTRQVSKLRPEPCQTLWCPRAKCTARKPCQHKSHRHLTLALFASSFTKPTKATEKQTRGTKLLAVAFREQQNPHQL